MIKVLPFEVNDKKTFLLWGKCADFNNLPLYQSLRRLTGYEPLTIVLTHTVLDENGECKRSAQKPCAEALKSGTYFPIVDGDVQPLSNAVMAAVSAYKALLVGRPVICCCHGGVGRSNTCALATLTLLTGKCFGELIAEIKGHVAKLTPVGVSSRLALDGEAELAELLPETTHTVSLKHGAPSECCNIEGLSDEEKKELCAGHQAQYLIALYQLLHQLLNTVKVEGE